MSRDPEGARRSNWLAHALAIGRVEFVRGARTVRAETNKLVGIGIGVLVLAMGSLVVAAFVAAFGDDLSSLDPALLTGVRAAAAGGWLMAAVLVTFRTATAVGTVDHQEFLLSTVSARSVLGGLMLAELGKLTAYVGFPVVAVGGGLWLGTGSPLPALALVAAVAAVGATAVPLGFLAGLSILLVTRTVPAARRNRLWLALVGMVGYLLVILRFGELSLLLAETPAGWFADPVLLAAGAPAEPALAAVALACPLVAVPLFGAAAETVAVRTWYADRPVDQDDGDADGGALLDDAGARLDAVVARPTAAVVRASWLRARRSPFTLSYALVPAFALIGYLFPALQEGRIPDLLPVMVAGYAAWSVGAAFTLNPLGEEGALLPVTLTTGIGGREFVRGKLLAAWLVGVPGAVALTLVSAVLVGSEPGEALAQVAYAGVLTLLAPAISAGFGMAMPKFSTQRVMLNREAVVPSVLAFFGFLILLGIVGLPGFLGLTLFAEGGLFGLPGGGFGGVVVSAALGLVFAVPGYVFAVKRFDRYDVDDLSGFDR